MVRALLRRARSDLRSNALQHFLIFVILTVATMALAIALIVYRSADDPWDRIFKETNGPHVYLVTDDVSLDFDVVRNRPEVAEANDDVLALTNHPLVINNEKHAIFLCAMSELPQVGRPKLVEGRWLNAAGSDEIVLDYSLARYYDLKAGDTVHILAADGLRPLTVVGLAVTSHWIPYDASTKDLAPGSAYILPSTLTEIEPDTAQQWKVLGLRLKDPNASTAFIEEALRLTHNRLTASLDWQWVRSIVAFSNQISVLFLGFFCVLSLAAVGFIIANAIGGHVLAHYRDIGLLKAIGFTPRHIMLLLLLEHLSVGLAAVFVGLVLGALTAPALANRTASLLNTSAPSVFDPLFVLAVVIVIEGAVALFTVLPAWYGSHIDTVRAITRGYERQHRRASVLAGPARWLRLPPVVVLGIKDVFSRPLRAVLTITGLMLTVLVVLFAIGAQVSVKKLTENTTYFQGTPADLLIDRAFVPDNEVRALFATHSEIESYYSELRGNGWVPGHTEPITYRFVTDNYAASDFDIQEGRMITGPGEAVVAYGTLTLLHASVGDDITLMIEGKPLKLTIVGWYMEMSNVGRVVLGDLETYRQHIDPSAEPQFYGLELVLGSDAGVLRDALLRQSGGQFNVQIVSQAPNPQTAQLRDIIGILGVMLTVIALVNLLNTTLLSVRERVRDFGIEKTLGLTPAQIAFSVITGVNVLAIIALILGIPLGLAAYHRFLVSVGEQIGTGPGFEQMDWRLLALLLPGVVLLAAVSSAIPARRAVRLTVADALRYE
jgi:putative ABC transport system permease protein